MQLSQEENKILDCFFAFLKSVLYFKHLTKKDDTHS